MSTPSQSRELRVVFQPSGRTVMVLPGTTLLEAAARAGLVLQTPCGGGGTCGKCLVRVHAGAVTRAAAAHRLSPEQAAAGWCLACATRVDGDAVVEVPASSMFEQTHRILTSDAGHLLAVAPAVTTTFVDLPPPTREDDTPDLGRVERALGQPLAFPLDVLADLPGRLRDANWEVHLVHENGRVLDVLPGTEPPVLLGVGFDLGTTTVVGTLLDLATGRELAVASTLNGQIPYGDDVLARILRVRSGRDARADLQAAARTSLNAVLKGLYEQAGVRPSQVYAVALAGNTTMQQLVCGIDPSALGELPFVPAFARGLTLDAARLGLDVHPAASLYVFPQVGGFVGGDTVAGMLTANFDRLTRPTLLVDIGTNGEIALFHQGRIRCSSTAAGPAFEGARISQGMRAAAGAIEKVIVQDGRLLANVIGNVPPAGLCGTALIDAVAELLRHGIIDTTGRILPPDELPANLTDDLRGRVRPDPVGDGSEQRVQLAENDNGGVWLRQRDVRELQLASGALRAGVDTLLQQAGLAPADLEAVLLAGAFGNFIRRNNAQRIGLLPPLPHERIRFIGNASSMGAKMALLSTAERARAEALARASEHVDLSASPDFQMAFAQAMLFPES